MEANAALILLSGGLDSAANLAFAARDRVAKIAITANYGQRAAKKEISAARALAAHFSVPWESVDLTWLGAISNDAITQVDQVLPRLKKEELDDPEITKKSMQAVWVANRNGLLLNMAACYAEAKGISRVLVGFNREEAASFPDNSQEFMTRVNESLSYSTLNRVVVDSYTVDWDKPRIALEAKKAGLPVDLIWACYEAGPERCDQCESCLRFNRAMEDR